MRRPPRRQDEALFGIPQLAVALVQGAGMLAGVFGLYVWALTRWPAPEARGAAFAALVIGNLVLALSDAMSGEGKLLAPHRRIYWLITAGAAGLLAVVLAAPAAAAMFQIVRPDGPLLAAAIGAALVAGGWWGLGVRLRAALVRA